MWTLGTLLLLLASCLTAGGNPVPTPPDDDIQVQENFDLSRIYGKWFNVAIGSTCPWLKKFQSRLSMSTLVLGDGATDTEISTTSTRWRKGLCEETSGAYQKTSTEGKFFYHKPKWNVTLESYVVHTNYDEYAIFLTKKVSRHGPTVTAKLYGRQPQLRDSLVEDFRDFALSMGIPEDSIFTTADRGSQHPHPQTENRDHRIFLPGVTCAFGLSPRWLAAQRPRCHEDPGTPCGKVAAPSLIAASPSPGQRARRAVLPQEEEGSGAGQPTPDFNKKEDSCQLAPAAGPCLGLINRYFYNTSSMACEVFQYGGCLGNGNKFALEKECLQTCRTVAACSLPIISGPCRASMELWAFDAAQGKCVLFSYSGCHGNGNKFYSEKECKEYCRGPGGDDEELLRVTN
ncbi:protein AMBP [Echinops telfairi]|uniref:Protein AMBP n=1 Tax=Echinops telfairi TaxID=9371 RepID=A0AC55DL57_ECHTE|nr:protein AMBP [Echinops telfairi]